MMKTVFVCGNTMTSIFSAIYDAWTWKEGPEKCGIGIQGSLEQELFCEYVESKEEYRKVLAVERMIQKHLGGIAHLELTRAALSNDKNKGNAILGTMCVAKTLNNSKRIMDYLSHPDVEKVFELSRYVGKEAHNYKGFVRFRELQNGVLFSEITPKNQVLPMIAPHFTDRFPQENWMIYDKTNEVYAVHEKGKNWLLVKTDKPDEDYIHNVTEEEEAFATMWKGFCKTIAIEERRNPTCQLSHLPLRYRPDMVEMN